MGVYRLQKCIEYESNTNDAAYILFEEIHRNVRPIEPDSCTSIQISVRHTKHDIYTGLMHTGNIKYFDSDLQGELDALYDQTASDSISADAESFDMANYKNIYAKLTEIQKFRKKQCIKRLFFR